MGGVSSQNDHGSSARRGSTATSSSAARSGERSPGFDRGRELPHPLAQRRIVVRRRAQRVLQGLLRPAHLQCRALLRPDARLLERVSMRLDRAPHVFDAGTRLRRALEHRHRPARMPRRHERQRLRELGPGAVRRGEVVAVGLGDRDDVDALEEPALDPLQLVAARRSARARASCRRCRPRSPPTDRPRRSRPARRRSPPPRTAACSRGCALRHRRAHRRPARDG